MESFSLLKIDCITFLSLNNACYPFEKIHFRYKMQWIYGTLKGSENIQQVTSEIFSNSIMNNSCLFDNYCVRPLIVSELFISHCSTKQEIVISCKI